MAKYFPNLMKNINIYIQGSASSSINAETHIQKYHSKNARYCSLNQLGKNEKD